VCSSRAYSERTPALSLPLSLSLSSSTSRPLFSLPLSKQLARGSSRRCHRERTYKRVLSPAIRRYEWKAYMYAPPFAYPGVMSEVSRRLSFFLSSLHRYLSLSLFFFSLPCSSRNSFSLGSGYLIDIPGERFPAGARRSCSRSGRRSSLGEARPAHERKRERERERGTLVPVATTAMMLTASTHGARASERACVRAYARMTDTVRYRVSRSPAVAALSDDSISSSPVRSQRRAPIPTERDSTARRRVFASE